MSLRFTSALLAFSLTVLTLGCKPEDEIHVYTVPRTSAPRKPLEAGVVASLLDHTLAAIVPQGEKAWFFKLAGPAKAIDRQREAFLEFLSTVKLAENAAENPTWVIPKQWEERPASEMRIATLVISDEQGPMELAVSSLPFSGKWEEYLVPNVNRWLRQLGESALNEETILKLTKQVELQNGSATLIELVGRLPKKNSGNPHAGIPGAPPIGAAEPVKQKPAIKSKVLTYDTPAGWLPGRMAAMRKAAFEVVEGDRKAEVTVIDLSVSAGVQVTDVEANMQRWAREVKSSDLDTAALQKLVVPITIDGIVGNYAEIFGPETAEPREGSLVAMIIRDDKVWFFKMRGDVDIVKGQRDAFRGFFESVKFSETAQ